MPTVEEKLAEYVEDAHAMEQNVLRMLDSMIDTTKDPAIKAELEHHRTQTQQHEERLRQRLDQMGRGRSAVKDVGMAASAMAKGMFDQMRGDKPGRNARDGYVAEHMEIAAYELLERIARRAGDPVTAEIARVNRQDEVEMARKIEAKWDEFVTLSLAEEGIKS
jgi:ferritin-like metal-binding protein YciE